MLRFTCIRRISPFAVFVSDLSKAKKISHPNMFKKAAPLYKKLNAKQLASLRQRASKISAPQLVAFNKLQKLIRQRHPNLSGAQRQREVGKLWAKRKQNLALAKKKKTNKKSTALKKKKMAAKPRRIASAKSLVKSKAAARRK